MSGVDVTRFESLEQLIRRVIRDELRRFHEGSAPGEWVSIAEASKRSDAPCWQIRKWIKSGVLEATITRRPGHVVNCHGERRRRPGFARVRLRDVVALHEREGER